MSDPETTRILLKARRLGVYLYLKDGQLAFRATNKSLTPELREEIRRHKEKIIEYFHLIDDNAPQVNRLAVNDGPLSFSQNRLWLIDQIDPGNGQYNILVNLRLDGELIVGVLNRAFCALVERHEALRTTFLADAAGQPRQQIRSDLKFTITQTDLSDLPKADQKNQVIEHLHTEALRPFDLTSDLMIRVHLLKLSATCHVLQMTTHHIASDGWSQGILLKDLSFFYNAYLSGSPAELSPIPIRYLDYAHWQREWLDGDAQTRHLSYWKKQLSDLPAVHGLPLDHPRPEVTDHIGASFYQHIAVDTLIKLQALALAHGATLFMVLNAAFSVLLSRYSDDTDIVIGTPVANRDQAELAPLVGFFINTLVIRNDLSGNPSFETLLLRSKQTFLEAHEHQQVPFEKLVDELQPERSLSYTPLFQIMLSLQNNESAALELPDLEIDYVDIQSTHAKFDITLTAKEERDGLSLVWRYAKTLFDAVSIERMAGSFATLLDEIVNKPQTPVSEYSLLSASDKRLVMVDWNGTEVDYPKDTSIDQLFELQAEHTPDALAIVYNRKTLTYAELNAAANQVAFSLKEQGVTDETLVGLCVDRSVEMIIGLLGILKSGGAYVPLDPNYPAARLEYMVRDSGTEVLVTQSSIRELLEGKTRSLMLLDYDTCLQVRTLNVTDTPAVNHANDPAKNVTSNPRPKNATNRRLAYLIYTSGSTGNPKGVLVEHKSLVNLAFNLDDLLGLMRLGSATTWALNAGMSFDSSVKGLMTLCFGGSLVVVPQSVRTDPAKLLSYCHQLDVTHLDCTPVMANELSSLCLSQNVSCPHLLVGGEAINHQLWRKLEMLSSSQGISIFNVYGPTEATVNSVWCQVSGDRPVLGHLLNNVKAYVQSDSGQLQPVGVAGELCLTGVGVSRGYLNRQSLTAEKFVPNRYGDSGDYGRMYRTGDRVRWLPNSSEGGGTLEFLGRRDNQVKIRGYRIELGEIESHMSMLDRVHAVVVRLRGNPARLVAYLVLQSHFDGGESDRVALNREFHSRLSSTLPEHMVPSVFVFLDELPLTSNGKVDYAKLPDPSTQNVNQTVIEPQTRTEQLLCGLWSDLLNLPKEQISMTNSFFELGGHSLLAVRLMSKIDQVFSVDLPVRILFLHSTIERLAGYIDREDFRATKGVFGVDQLNSNSEKSNLFIAPALGLLSISYSSLASHLSSRYQISVLTTPGIDEVVPVDSEMLHADEKVRITQWLLAIKEAQATGPYNIIGHSLGGNFAFELALLLEQEGEQVHLILIDSVLSTPVCVEEVRHRVSILSEDSVSYALNSLLVSENEDTPLSSAHIDNYKVAVSRQTELFQMYRPSGTFGGQVSLIQADQGLAISPHHDAVIDYIQRHCLQPLTLISTPGTHRSVIDQVHLSICIDNALSPD